MVLVVAACGSGAAAANSVGQAVTIGRADRVRRTPDL
jgi:hypothetical protein